VGQDQKSLGALIVPNCAALQQWASQEKLSLDFPEDLSTPLSPAQQAALETPQVQNLIRQELAREVKDRPSYRADDRITVFRILQEPFSITNGLMTQTLKIRRPVVTERYQAMIDEMFS
jgi:long-chain acyl-CoA synthetase